MDRLFKFKNTIDDTPRVVARDFVKKYRSAKPVARKATPKVTNAELQKNPVLQKPGKVSKKDQARKLFVAGNSAAEVSKIMEITYANAHYYLRAFRKAGGDIGQEIK
jgi:hypothetical protein